MRTYFTAAKRARGTMDELMKTLERKEEDGSDQEPADVDGLLAVHITAIHTVKEEGEASMVDLLQLRASFRGHTKRFPIFFSSENPNRIGCGATRHLPIQLPKDSDSPENWLNLELVIKSPLLLVQDTVLARGMLHVHTIIHDSPLSGECELREASGEVFALLSGEFVFTYGMFGFGESFQLHHPVMRPGHFLHHSMFPRLLPPEPRADTNRILIPLPIRHPSFIPFKQKASLSNHHETFSTVLNPRPALLTSRMTRLHSLREEYERKKDRHQRLAFLQGLVLKKSPASSDLDIRVTARNKRSN